MPDWIWWLVAIAAAVVAVLAGVLVRGRTPKWFSVPVFVGAAALAGWAGFSATCASLSPAKSIAPVRPPLPKSETLSRGSYICAHAHPTLCRK
jgi:ABC-type xylose transport system permease subunit